MYTISTICPTQYPAPNSRYNNILHLVPRPGGRHGHLCSLHVCGPRPHNLCHEREEAREKDLSQGCSQSEQFHRWNRSRVSKEGEGSQDSDHHHHLHLHTLPVLVGNKVFCSWHILPLSPQRSLLGSSAQKNCCCLSRFMGIDYYYLRASYPWPEQSYDPTYPVRWVSQFYTINDVSQVRWLDN